MPGKVQDLLAEIKRINVDVAAGNLLLRACGKTQEKKKDVTRERQRQRQTTTETEVEMRGLLNERKDRGRGRDKSGDVSHL